jgi:CRP/FNR family transcriptional regulator, cyclic AMP receptor protein
MTIQEPRAIAKDHPLLANIGKNHLSKLLGIAKKIGFDADQVIFDEDQKSEDLYLIVSGKVALEVTTAGRRIAIQTLSAGDVMGWSALTSDAKTHFRARTLSAVEALAFDRAKLQFAMKSDRSLGYEVTNRLLAVVTERIDHTRMQIMDMYGKPGQPICVSENYFG